MPTTQKISVLDVCMYPKAPPWKSVKDPGGLDQCDNSRGR